MNDQHVIIVSDGTGETASHAIKAALVQFQKMNMRFSRFKNVRTRQQIEAICKAASVKKDLIIHTLASGKLREYVDKLAKQYGLITVDLLGPLLNGLADYLGYKPTAVAGLLHDVNEEYFERIDAMEYTIAHDDGKDLTGLDNADLIILGISRTSKTPISMYLSHHGWKVANIPLVNGSEIPKEVYEVDQRKIVALTIDSEELAKIRRARLERLGHHRGGEYADMQKVYDEVEYANELFRKNRKWVVLNVTGKALEETASEIIKIMTSRGLAPETPTPDK